MSKVDLLLKPNADVTREVRNAGRNFGYTAIATLADGGLLFVILTMVGRLMGPSAYGEFFVAYSLVTLAFVLTESGLNLVINREIARDHKSAPRFLGNALGIRLVLLVTTVVLLVAFAKGVGFSAALSDRVSTLTVYFGTWYLSQLFVAVLRAHERMDYATTVVVVERITILLFIVGFQKTGVAWFPVELAFLTGGVLRLVVSLLLVRRVVGWPVPRIERSLWQALLWKSIPLGVTSVLTMIYFRIDTLMISWMVPDSNPIVGRYSAAYTLFIGATVLASAVNLAVFPIFARLQVASTKQLRALCSFVFIGLASLGVVVAILLYLLADPLVGLIYGSAFENASGILKILSLAVLFTYISNLATALLPAVDRTPEFVTIVSLSALINVSLNLALIPRYGARGAALATVVTECATAVTGMFFLARYLRERRDLRTAPMAKIPVASSG